MNTKYPTTLIYYVVKYVPEAYNLQYDTAYYGKISSATRAFVPTCLDIIAVKDVKYIPRSV